MAKNFTESIKQNISDIKNTEFQRSKTWGEFCKKNNFTEGEAYIGESSEIKEINPEYCILRSSHIDRNVIPSRYVESVLALMQLLTIREKEYIPKGWNPNDIDEIAVIADSLDDGFHVYMMPAGWRAVRLFTFPTKELAEEFLNNWRYLIETAASMV